MKKPLMLLIDGTNLTHAIYHATRGGTVADQMRCLRSRVAALRTLSPKPKAIAGDKSDAIAGMAGLGDTAARAICKRYASFDEALADRWKTPLSPRQFATFEAAVRDGSAVRDQKLCTLVFDVDIENGSEPVGMEAANAHRSNDR